MTFGKRYILLTSFVLLLLGGSIALNFILYNQAKKYYLELNQTRLDPLGLSSYPADAQENTPARPFRVIFFGDSRAASWPDPTAVPSSLSEVEFLNRGIASQTSIQTLQRFSSHVGSLKPKVIVIQVGVNDLKAIALFPERKTEIVTHCQANIRQIVEASRNLGAIVILTTIFPVGEVPLERQPFWSNDIAQAIKQVNAYITTFANDRTIVLDTFPILADRQGKLLQQYKADELHLNTHGYAVLNQKLLPLIHAIRQRPRNSGGRGKGMRW
jgi:lysophospholipase L1-like esterase